MTQELSIGIVTPTLSRSGGGIFPIVRGHAKGLYARPNSIVTVYGLSDPFTDVDVGSMAPAIPLVYDPMVRRFGYAPQLTRDLLKSDHQVVHQHGLWQYPSVAVSRWRRATQRPTLISTQGMLEPWAVANSSLKKRIAAALFERSNLAQASCIHCSEAEVAGVRAFGLTNPIAVIPNGVDLPVGSEQDIQRPEWMDGDRKVLLFLGRIHPKKGITELLRAWSLFRTRSPETAQAWQLAVAGWDDGGHELGAKTLAAELGLGTSVVFPGSLYAYRKAAALSHAAAFVLPSFSEGLPMTVLEAWSYGRPVLMTRECNLSQAFEEEAAIEITTVPEALAEQLASALAREDLSRIGENGRELVEQRFTWPSVVAELHSVYQWLCGQAPRPSCVRMS